MARCKPRLGDMAETALSIISDGLGNLMFGSCLRFSNKGLWGQGRVPAV
jgi:hypothetical protein